MVHKVCLLNNITLYKKIFVVYLSLEIVLNYIPYYLHIGDMNLFLPMRLWEVEVQIIQISLSCI